MRKMIFTVIGVVAELNRSLIRERVVGEQSSQAKQTVGTPAGLR
jgi:DNA invertase Pin-like site-specific DNA recombinase